MMSELPSNHLSFESSPYLLQHVHNPVDWYPWGDEALERSRREDKPIFLSIGYAACHWCHVMEKESFENETIARLLNDSFISIKVDREERPDLDEIYMTAVQLLTGSGGWPMSVFLTPELKPFYGGTYFPPEERFGRPGFGSLLRQIAKVWSQQREELNESAGQITEALRQHAAGPSASTRAITPSLLDQAAESLGKNFDRHHGGFGGAPKFPASQSIMLLLRHARRTGSEKSLRMATHTLDRMAYGGLYDQLAGGFHRYSVDERWLVPHFEKMLYDNGQLAQVYIEAWQHTGNAHYERVVREILTYTEERMTDAGGAFFSTEDADSEGEEGKFYVWQQDELLKELGETDGRLFSSYFNVREEGNFASHEPYHEGQNILHVQTSPEAFAAEHGMRGDEWLAKLEKLKQKLRARREARVHPGLDDKVITGWNGLMISAAARAAAAFADERFLRLGTRAADFILHHLRPEGELLHTWRRGQAKLPAYLDDYAYLIQALIDLYEASFAWRWLDAAMELTEQMNARFWDEDAGGYFYTSSEHRHLITRVKSMQDGAIPSGNAMAATALLRLAVLMDRDDYRKKAEEILRLAHDGMGQSPRGFMQMLIAADFQLDSPPEIVIVGSLDAPATQELLRVVNQHFLPNRVLAHLDPAADKAASAVPLLAGKRRIEGQPTAYVCRDFACGQPVTTPAALAAQLAISAAEEGAS